MDNSKLAKLLQCLKKDLPVDTVRQGYKGTGTKAHCRQIFVSFANGKTIDLWLESNMVALGGVCMHGYGWVGCPRCAPSETPEQVYQKVLVALTPLCQ